MHFLLIDNYDSFTFMLSDYIQQTGVKCTIIRNDEEQLLHLNPTDFDALVISPGPSAPKDAGFMLLILERFLHQLPVLGICLGHQAIGELFGAQLLHAKLPRHGKVDFIAHNNDFMFSGVPNQFQATRYHSLILQNLPEILTVTATCNDEIMALKHRELPIWGLQFHPESCETKEGLKILNNFTSLVKTLAANKI
ncbi:MAG: anthranilate synthase component II [Bacteroidia bacterium]